MCDDDLIEDGDIVRGRRNQHEPAHFSIRYASP